MADVSSIKYTSSSSVNIKYKAGREKMLDIQAYIGMFDPRMTGIYADFTNNIFRRIGGGGLLNHGTDFDRYAMYGNRTRCTVDDFGNITSRYGDNNYAEDGSIGQVMVYQPKFYYKVIPIKTSTNNDGNKVMDVGIYYISDEKLDGFKCHPAFTDDDGNETDGYFIGAFEASLYDTSEREYRIYDTWSVEHTEGTSVYRITAFDAYPADAGSDLLCSISGVKPASGKYSPQFTRAGVQQMAKNRGSKWGIIDHRILSAEQFLFICEYGSFNAQTSIGMGASNCSTSGENIGRFTGSTVGNTTGLAARSYYLTGTNVYMSDTAANRVSSSYRGVENHWGDMEKIVEGINVYGDSLHLGGVPYVCTDHDFAEDTISDNYETTGFSIPYADQKYIYRFGYNEDYDWLFIPVEINTTYANSSLPVGDNLYTDSNNLDGFKMVVMGGYWNGGYGNGMFDFIAKRDYDNTDHTVSTRLVRYDSKPLYTIGDVIDLSEASYTLQENDLTAVGFRIYGDENGIGDMFDDVRAVLSVSPAPSTTPAFNASTYKLGEILYEGDYVDVFVYYEDAYSGSREGNIATALAACTTSTVFSGGSQAMYIKKFSFIYPKS